MAERRTMQRITHKPGQRDIGATRRADTDYTRTVTVACKIPNGLILRTFHWVNEPVQTPQGVRDTKVAAQDPEVFHVKGPALPFGKMPASFTIKDGFALTRGIPEAFWQRWLEQNKDLDAVKNGLVFACSTLGDAERAAKDHAGLKSGLEPLDPNNLPREFKKIKTATKNDD